MANTLTNLIPNVYRGLDTVSRELVGFIPAVFRNAGVDQVAKDQIIRVPVVPAVTAADTTPAVNAPDTGDASIGNITLTISKSRHVAIRINGEEDMGLRSAGTADLVMQARFAQAFRTLTGEMEADLAALYTQASRAWGTAGTTPFATANDLSDIAQARRILEENGAPLSDLQLVLGSAAIASLRGKQSSLFKVSEAGSDQLLRTGLTALPIEGFTIRASAAVKTHTPGTADANYLVDQVAGYVAGDTTIHLDTGAGTHVAGDVITFQSDTSNYVIKTGDGGSGDKDIIIQEPGLRLSLANNKTSAIAAAYSANMAFSSSAIVLATRLPARPPGGDAADDVQIIVDPVTGIAFELSVYRQFRQVHYQVAAAWGVACIAPRHVGLLLG